MFYTTQEREDLYAHSPIMFAEKTHTFPCCDIPTIQMCLDCTLKAANVCKNKLYVDTLRIEIIYMCAVCDGQPCVIRVTGSHDAPVSCPISKSNPANWKERKS